jgi:hypothetical protein
MCDSDRYVGVRVLQAIDGHSTESVVVKWIRRKELAFWELRGMFRYVTNTPSGRLAQFAQRTAEPCWACLVTLGWPREEHVLPSCKAASAKGIALNSNFEQEFVVSTAAFVLLLFWLIQHRRALMQKQRSKQFAIAFFACFVVNIKEVMSDTRTISPEIADLCIVDVDPRLGFCKHVVNFSQGMVGADEDQSDVCRLIERGSAIVDALHKEDCASLRQVLKRLVLKVADECRANITDTGEPTIGQLRENVLRGTKRSLRVDSDFKRAVIKKVASSDRMSIMQIDGRDGEACCRDTIHWLSEHLQSYIANMHATFSKVKSLTLTPDASRLGNPAEDMLVYPAFSADLNRGAWLVPQVTSRRV